MKTNLFSALLHNRLALVALATIVPAVYATPIPIVNGGFESTTLPISSEFGDRVPSQQVTGWSTDGYNFVFTPGTADNGTGAITEFPGTLQLWGPGNGSNNGLPATSPAGGNYIAADGAFTTAPITQEITGLIPGIHTTITFWFAGAQQNGFTGPNTEQWAVSLGSQTDTTAILNNASHGFTGWQQITMDFHPTSSTETLSFLAIGTPTGVPPFSLLDGVTGAQTPEPGSFALLFTGLAGVGGLVRNRFKKSTI
jgi:hypothetical protein